MTMEEKDAVIAELREQLDREIASKFTYRRKYEEQLKLVVSLKKQLQSIKSLSADISTLCS